MCLELGDLPPGKWEKPEFGAGLVIVEGGNHGLGGTRDYGEHRA